MTTLLTKIQNQIIREVFLKKMTYQEIVKLMVDYKYKVYVGGEKERTTDVLGLLQLLADYSDFFQYTKKEKTKYLKDSIKEKTFYIDANITCKI